MSDRLAPKELVRLLSKIQHHRGAQQQPAAGDALDPQLALLRAWQSARLAHTYADLLADDHYRPACQFFLSDIYAPRDFSQRDHDAQHLYAGLKRYLPELMLQSLADAIQISQLSDQLDRSLLFVLVEKLGVRDVIIPQVYAEGYRLCENYEERKQQIILLVKILNEVGKGARNRLVEVSLRLAKAPAERAGWSELYDFLRRGYDACKPIRDFGFFVTTIQRREEMILEKIYSGNTNPFDLGGNG